MVPEFINIIFERNFRPNVIKDFKGGKGWRNEEG